MLKTPLINKIKIVICRSPEYLNSYLKILKGNKNNKRTKFGLLDLSADEQVDCLIDIATDPAILGITFSGYKPYI